MAATASAGLRPSGSPASTPAPPPPGRSLSARTTLARLWRPLALVVGLVAAWWAVTAAELVAPVFQRAALLEWRSVRKNILLQAEMRGMPRQAAQRRCQHLIEMTGLSGFENAMPYELSGGMQQRVSLCRALLHEPNVLLMDEPFGALDALTREKMNVELHRIWRETRTTVVLVTHSVAEAAYLANRAVVMSPRPGRIVETLNVDLPSERDYAETMKRPEFIRVANRARDLLGSSSGAD
jgi:NitT/TauT family transport system ATP-binding protein